MLDARAQLSPGWIEQTYRVALDWAAQRRPFLHERFMQRGPAQRKADDSLVTDTDLAAERQWRSAIERAFPDHGIIGEEYPARHPNAEFQWILDPIDGTEDFSRGIPYYGSIVALHYHGLPVIGIIDHPSLDLCVSAGFGLGSFRNGERFQLAPVAGDFQIERALVVCAARANFVRYRDQGLRFERVTQRCPNIRTFRTCYGHSLAALGQADAMIEAHVHLWDLAASRLITEEAGGRYIETEVLDLPDGDRVYSAVFGRPEAVADIVPLLNP